MRTVIGWLLVVTGIAFMAGCILVLRKVGPWEIALFGALLFGGGKVLDPVDFDALLEKARVFLPGAR